MADRRKWIQKARQRMESQGTTGSLRSRAQRMGLLSGKGDTLTDADLDRLSAVAKRRGDGELAKKVNFARNARGRK